MATLTWHVEIRVSYVWTCGQLTCFHENWIRNSSQHCKREDNVFACLKQAHNTYDCTTNVLFLVESGPYKCDNWFLSASYAVSMKYSWQHCTPAKIRKGSCIHLQTCSAFVMWKKEYTRVASLKWTQTLFDRCNLLNISQALGSLMMQTKLSTSMNLISHAVCQFLLISSDTSSSHAWLDSHIFLRPLSNVL